jgi:hypothetical protein
MLIIIVFLQLHFVLALSKYYAQLRREVTLGISNNCDGKQEHGLQRIYLLPTPTSSTFPPVNFNHHENSDSNSAAAAYYRDDPASENIIVYAPVPLNRLSLEDARELHATEAWISPVLSTPRTHRHHRHHSHAHLHSGTRHHKHRRASLSSVMGTPYRDESQISLVEKA